MKIVQNLVNEYTAFSVTHPFKKGVPRLHEYRYPPTVGGSVAIKFGRHISTLLTKAWLPKSRASTSKRFPEIWKESV